MRIIFVCLLLCLAGINAARMNCKPMINGVQYDITPMISNSGGYLFTGSLNNTKYYFQMQFCENIAPQPINACSRPSPVNQISQDKSQCIALGDSTAYAWDPTPSKDGIMLSIYHGEYMNNIATRETKVYFLCDPKTTMGPIEFEHMRICTDSSNGLQLGGQYHFSVQTKYACSPSQLIH